jgi:nucleoside-diphosphate-sugar epimerase
VILLTGGTGFVGRHLAQQFITNGRRVRILSRAPGRMAFPDGVSWARGDLADTSSLDAALAGIDIVVHAAAVLPRGPTAGQLLELVNVRGTGALAAAARKAGVRRMVHVSSAGVYGDGITSRPHQESDVPAPGTAYERSKLAAETTLRDELAGSGVSWTVLRPQGIYGADRPATAAFFHDVAKRRFWLHAAPNVLVHPTYIDDVVTGVALAVDSPDVNGEIINLAGERALELSQLIALIGARMGHAPRQIRAPRWTSRGAAMVARTWGRFGAPPAMVSRHARAWINRSVDIAKARRLLGFQPVPLEWGLDQTVAGIRLAEAA